MRFAKYGMAVLLMVATVGCGSTNVEVVDLNKVLDVFGDTLTELDGKHSDKGEAEVEVVDEASEKAEFQKEFVDLYTTNLNKAKLVSGSIGVVMAPSGDIEGFKDKNSDMKKDAGEKKLFSIQIDEENSRVVATDDTYYRDHSYNRRSGFFTGYLIGSMMGRNRSYYSGSRMGSKPNFTGKTMSPKNYHQGAVSKAKSRAKAKSRSSSSRSRSGSRSSGFGK